MNTSFHTVRKHLIVALSVLGMGAASLTVHAQQAPASTPATSAASNPKAAPDGPRAHRGERGNPAERMAKYQARLHDKLKLTAAQEPAWTTFTAASAPKKPAGDWKAKREAFATLSAPERMEQSIAMSKERIAGQESRLASLKTFYAVLTPEQQKVFNDSVPGGKGGHRGHGPHSGGPRHTAG